MTPHGTSPHATTRRPLRHRVAVAAAAVTALLAGSTAPAVATGSGDGLWYFTETGIAEAHQRTRGEGITIAVIDGTINPDAPDLVGANVTVHEPSYCAATPGGPAVTARTTAPDAVHGTTVTSMIAGTGLGTGGLTGTVGVAPGAEVRFYSVASSVNGRDIECSHSDVLMGDQMAAAIGQAVADGADIISISIGEIESTEKDDAIAAAQRAGVILVVSVPNTSFEPDSPSNANGVVAVERSDVDGSSATDTMEPTPWITVAAPGQHVRLSSPTWDGYVLASGSSYATPFTAGVLALVWSAYPGATANQMIQSLIRNTGPTDHELARTAELGYGIVNVQQMLAHDPTTYPDENPLLRDDAEPSTAAILGQPEPGADATTAPPADAQDTTSPEATSSVSPLLIAVAGALGVLVLTGIVIAVVLTRRARRTTATSPPSPGPRV